MLISRTRSEIQQARSTIIALRIPVLMRHVQQVSPMHASSLSLTYYHMEMEIQMVTNLLQNR